jgi:hypothetical protein
MGKVEVIREVLARRAAARSDRDGESGAGRRQLDRGQDR